MADTHNPIDLAVYTALTAATALTALLSGGTADPSVYQWLAPEGADPPYVVYSVQSPSTPVYTFSGVAYENTVYQVKGVTDDHSARAAGTIAAEIDDALADAGLTVSGYTLMRCRRLQNVDFLEVDAGKRFNHRGALYRIEADPT
ncbi:MAG: DUF3168 domain-containing protein [Gemmatimonadaceae bacterium]|nr:DUF3168 domain-containing protein [Gemmatimonadaceae bacterium]